MILDGQVSDPVLVLHGVPLDIGLWFLIQNEMFSMNYLWYHKFDMKHKARSSPMHITMLGVISSENSYL